MSNTTLGSSSGMLIVSAHCYIIAKHFNDIFSGRPADTTNKFSGFAIVKTMDWSIIVFK